MKKERFGSLTINTKNRRMTGFSSKLKKERLFIAEIILLDDDIIACVRGPAHGVGDGIPAAAAAPVHGASTPTHGASTTGQSTVSGDSLASELVLDSDSRTAEPRTRNHARLPLSERHVNHKVYGSPFHGPHQK